MGFFRQEYWSGWPFPSPWDLHDPGIEPVSLVLQVDPLPTEPCFLMTQSYKIVSRKLHNYIQDDKGHRIRITFSLQFNSIQSFNRYLYVLVAQLGTTGNAKLNTTWMALVPRNVQSRQVTDLLNPGKKEHLWSLRTCFCNMYISIIGKTLSVWNERDLSSQ